MLNNLSKFVLCVKRKRLAWFLAAMGMLAVAVPPAWAVNLAAIDPFNAIAYTGSTGTAPWAGNWIEVGESNGPTSGLVRVTNDASYCVAPNCLRLGGNGVNFSNRGLRRVVNLTGASEATLSFSYKRQAVSNQASGSVRVQVSGNGSTWTTLGTIAFAAVSDSAPILASFNISTAVSATTQIRFLGTGTAQRGYLYIDDVTVAFVKDAAPVAANDNYATTSDAPLTVAAPGVLANDSDPEGASLTASLVTPPASGNLTFNANGSFTYTPTITGTAAFTYRANDGANNSNVATVSITVAAASNRSPVFNPASYSFNLKEDSIIGTLVGNLKASDPDTGDTLTYAIVTDSSGGLFSLNAASGAISLGAVPAAKLTVGQRYNLTVQVRDAAGLSAQATVVVAITPADKIVDLKVLVVATGTPAEDPGLDLIDDLLQQMGVPYQVLDTSRTPLTDADLRFSQNHARYNGVILTDSQSYVGHSGGLDPQGSVGLTLAEWQVLHEFERYFRLRESVISGWPASNASLDLNYGMGNVIGGSDFKGQWQQPAGGTEIFEYVNTANPLAITEWSYAAQPLELYTGVPSQNGNGPTVEPLLVCDPNSTAACTSQYTFVSRLRYNDGREVLLSTVNNAWWDTHAQVLAYEFLNFATKGVLLGSRQAHLAAHVDDLFLPDDLWDVESHTTPGTMTYLWSAQEVQNVVIQQQSFRAAHPLVGDFVLDFAFNGEGVEALNPLGTYKDQFAYINHSFSHMDMDVSAGTTYAMAYSDIDMNRSVWHSLGLPEYDANINTLVTGDHSGIMDDGTVPVTPYPDGANPAFLQAARDAGVRYLASNASQPNQAEEKFISAGGVQYDMLLLPRYPTNVFYNVTNPITLLDEYNWIFYYSYVNAGIDPCGVPAAICTPRASYAEILQAEADTALRHILSYKEWPHFFHMSNVANYGAGKTLVFDWLEAVVARYEQVMRLPIKNLRYYDIGKKTENRVNARAAQLTGQWDLTTNRVTVTANKPVTIRATGLDNDATGQCLGGELYGGQCQLSVDFGTIPKTLYVNQGLSN